MGSRKKTAIGLAIFYLAVAGFFVLFNPEKLPLVLLLLPFILVFLVLFVTTLLILRTFFNFEQKQERLVALAISIMPTLLLVIQSITQLTVRDVLISAAIVGLSVWYIGKTSKAS